MAADCAADCGGGIVATKMTALLLLLGAFAITPHARAASAALERLERVEQFQALLIASPVMGLPSAPQLIALAPYLSQSLKARLRAAIQAQQLITRRTPTPEPPIIQGSLFYSLFEGAARLVDVVPEENAPSMLVTVAYATQQNNTQPDPQPVIWTDRVMLITERGRSVIDDIQFLGDWDFSRKGTLTELLDQVIAAAK